MLITPDEYVLLLAKRWLKLQSDLGRAQATLTAYHSALRHYFAFCSQHRFKPEKARFEDMAAYISSQLPGMPFPAASTTFQLHLSAIRLWYDFLMCLDLCTVNPQPRSGTLNSGRGLAPRIVKLLRIPENAPVAVFSLSCSRFPAIRKKHGYFGGYRIISF